jgi:hypothetical protein
MLLISMSCGHKRVERDWPAESLVCLKHEQAMRVRLIAVECREWKTTCKSCRWARWFGQDRTTANLAASKHRHECNVDFLARDEPKAKVRELYGRRVRHFIADWEANRMKGGRVFNQPSMIPTRIVVDDDIPPF